MDDKIIITLTDESGKDVNYELLDVINYNNKTFAVFYPTIVGDTEVIILRVEDEALSDKANYIVETDENTINEVYKLFKEKYRGRILFADKKD